jgi:hypothetical protein
MAGGEGGRECGPEWVTEQFSVSRSLALWATIEVAIPKTSFPEFVVSGLDWLGYQARTREGE